MTSLFSTFVIAAVIAVQSAQSLNLSPIENTPVPRAPEAPKLFAQVNTFAVSDSSNTAAVKDDDDDVELDLKSRHHDDDDCHCRKKCPCPHLQDCGIAIDTGAGHIGEI